MATNVFTLREYADMVADLADNWDDDEPAVLVGDIAGDHSISEKDGFTQHGCVGYATETFDGNGVWSLGDKADPRFYGTMLVPLSVLSDEAREELRGRIEQEADEAEQSEGSQ